MFRCLTNSTKRAHATILIALWAMLLSGCGQLRIPAIDPTGERIFAPNNTTLASDICRGGLLPEPAFTPAPDIPPCPEPVVVSPPVLVNPNAAVTQPPVIAGPELVAPQGQPFLPGAVVAPTAVPGTIVLTPAELIAPVGSEVILQAGLCGGDGYYRTDEPIEWLVSRESVGQLLAVGSEPRPQFCSLLLDDERPLRTGDYALTSTLRMPQTLDRGTADPGDDVTVKSGQAWVTVTSAAPGVSRITAVAADSAGGNTLRATTTVHWVDAQWVIPPPSIVTAGQQHTLSTKLNRASRNVPIGGWVVRYEIVDGTPAEFVSGNGQRGTTADAISDPLGDASVAVVPTQTTAGTTRIKVTIIRPASLDGNTPELVVGEGWTSITWSAPGLAATLSGPEMMQAGETGNFRISVTNPGDVPITNVAVVHELPAGFAYVGGNPQGQVFGNRVQFNLSQLAAGSTQTIDLQLQATHGGDVQHRATVQSAEGLSAVAQTLTRVFQNSLAIAVTGPEQVEVGGQVTFTIRVRNQGNLALTNVVITDFLGAGLTHESGVNKVEQRIPRLDPGQEEGGPIVFTAAQAGQLCHQVQATADGGHHASTSACVTAVAPPRPAEPPPVPALSINVTGPQTAAEGDVIRFDTIVANTGDVPLTNVRILASWDPALLISAVDAGGYQRRGRDIYWVVPRIPARNEVRFTVQHVCQQAAGSACHRVAALCDELTQRDGAACVNIAARPARPANPPTLTQPENTQPPVDLGTLNLSVASLDNPARVGSVVNYLIVVRNNRRTSDRNVTLRVQLPAGLTINRVAEGPTAPVSQDPRTGVVTFGPVTELRAGETMTYKLQLNAAVTGNQQVTAEISSQQQPTPAIRAAAVTVY